MSRSAFPLLFLIAVSSAYALPSSADSERLGVKPGTGALRTLWWPQVQKELKLSDEQKQKVYELLREVWETARMEPMKPGAVPFRLDIITQAQQEQLGRILKPMQIKRLNELNLQVMGVSALGNPKVVNALRLTLEQRQKLKSALEEAREQMRRGGVCLVACHHRNHRNRHSKSKRS